MQLLNAVPFIIASTGSFGINTNILETNIINQAILVFGLFSIGGDFLSTSLTERQTEIVMNVQNSEESLEEAELRLKEAQKQLSQAKLIMDDIRSETKNTQLTLLESDSKQTKTEIQRKYQSALASLRNRERLILSEIKQQISVLAIEQVVKTLESQSGSETEQMQYTTSQIKMLQTTAVTKSKVCVEIAKSIKAAAYGSAIFELFILDAIF
jgi:F-type H+-transporting ATPase subunit b